MRRDPFNLVPTGPERQDAQQGDFKDLEAMELYCNECGRAVPVRKFLLLVLPDGDRYEYRCQLCGNKVGQKIDHTGQFYGILSR